MLDFQDIRLSASELKSLRRLDSEFQVYLSEFDRQSTSRLVNLGFASLMQFDVPGEDGPQFLELKSLGHDYLMYWSGIEAQQRLETRRYRVATGISILALIVALASLLADISSCQSKQTSHSTEAATSIPVECTSTPFCTDPTPTILPTGTHFPSASPAGSAARNSAASSLRPESSLP